MKQRTIFTLMVMLASILFFGCSKSSGELSLNPDGSVRTSGTSPTFYAARISIEAGGFNPADVTIMHTGTILWTNNTGTIHTVTADGEGFDSGDIPPGGTFTFTFNEVGPHTYKCKYHKEAGVVKAVTK